MTNRRAACSCGQLHLSIEGEPSRISMCHCVECQRRTGAVISNQARFRREQVTFAGKATAWMRTAESGNALTFHFCPTCGSTVYWEGEGFPGAFGILSQAAGYWPTQRTLWQSFTGLPAMSIKPYAACDRESYQCRRRTSLLYPSISRPPEQSVLPCHQT
jgi:hypothetical protein